MLIQIRICFWLIQICPLKQSLKLHILMQKDDFQRLTLFLSSWSKLNPKLTRLCSGFQNSPLLPSAPPCDIEILYHCCRQRRWIRALDIRIFILITQLLPVLCALARFKFSIIVVVKDFEFKLLILESSSSSLSTIINNNPYLLILPSLLWSNTLKAALTSSFKSQLPLKSQSQDQNHIITALPVNCELAQICVRFEMVAVKI